MGMVASMMATMGLNWSSFRTGAEAAKSHAGKIGSEIKSSLGEMASNAAGGFMLGSIIEGVPEAIGHIKDLSEQFRVSTDTVQRWQIAGGKVGLTAEDIGKAFLQLKRKREEAIEKNSVGDFGKFGMGMETLKDSTKEATDLMAMMGQAGLDHPLTDSEQVAAIELMGKAGSKTFAALQELQSLGPVKLIAQEDIEKLDAAEKRITEMKRILTVGAATGAAAAMPIFDKLGSWLGAASGFMSGDLSLNQAKQVGQEKDSNISAPQFDLKGRPLNGPKAQPVPEVPEAPKGNSYSVVQARSDKERAEISKDILETEKLRDQIAEKIEKNRQKALSGEERIAELKKQIAEHEKNAISEEFGGSEKESLKEKLKAEELRGEMDSISAKKFKVIGGDLTANQRIGAYANRPELVAIDVHKKNESHLAKIEKHLAQMQKVGGITRGIKH